MASADVESVERIIKAEPAAIFDLLADPARHKDIDGSGSVRETTTGHQRLALGSHFGMSMKLGVAYTTDNEVIEFEEGRRIAWQTGVKGFAAKLAGGRIWRYELEPVEGGTRVRESWDISQEKIKAFVKPARKKTLQSMERTLARIEELVTT